MRRIKTILTAFAVLLLVGCNGLERPYEGTYDQVLVYCALGYNNLSYDLLNNFDQIQEGIPRPPFSTNSSGIPSLTPACTWISSP